MRNKLILLSITLFSFIMSKAQDKTIAEIIKPYSFETQYVTLQDSIKVAYVDEGKGEHTLIFIHGLATYLPSWKKNIPQLSKKYRCLAVDLPGYGRSSKADYAGDMTFYCNIIHEFIIALKLKNVTLVGHSMGAQISITTALKYPKAISSLVLAAPAGFETFDTKEAAWLKSMFNPQAVAAATPEQLRFNYSLNFYNMPTDIEFMIEDRIDMTEAKDFELYCSTITKGVYGMLDEPVFSKLTELKQPVLVVYGTNDALIPNQILHKGTTTKQVAEKGMEKLPNATLKMIPECGHFVPFEKADIFNKMIVDFLSE